MATTSAIGEPEISTQQANTTRPELCKDLFTGPREDYLKIAVPLYEASLKCDWDAANAILEERPELVRYSITENEETALHVAASAKGHVKAETFLNKLVAKMQTAELALQNKNRHTALYLAAMAGNIKAVQIMADADPELLKIPGGTGTLPLYVAVLYGHHEVAKYLYDKSNDLGDDDGWETESRGWLLEKCVVNNMFGIALQIVKKYPELPDGKVLGVLARKPEAFRETQSEKSLLRTTFNHITRSIKSGFAFICCKGEAPKKDNNALNLLRIIWEGIAMKPKTEIDEILKGPPEVNQEVNTNVYSKRILFVAAEMGNTNFVVELLRLYPDLIWNVDGNNQTIFHIAVKHRHEGIYNLLYEIGSMKDSITPLQDSKKNNMLHLVGKRAKPKRLADVSGVALQMQRELLWFKEVEAMIPLSKRDQINQDGLTAYALFTSEHKDLVTQGEKWMKQTASQCMVVATLIATIVFAAAFTVPGGYGQIPDKIVGLPIFHSQVTFMVFVVADAISLFSSSSSILIFLSILTSRYAEGDFLKSLPQKLMFGLATLFLSITTMTIAFSVSFFVLYKKGALWTPILISVFAVMPIILYVWLQHSLFGDVYQSIYGSRYLFKPKKHVLYYSNPKV